MTGIFRQKTPGNIILLCVLGVLLKLPSFFHDTGYILKKGDGIFYTELISFLSVSLKGSAFLFALITFLINLLITFILNSFINNNRLMTRPNFLSGMAYILITSFLPAFNLLSSNLICSGLLFMAFTLFYKSYDSKGNIFNASLLIGLASLFFPPALLCIVWAYFALAVLRPFKISEWILVLLGITAPYYFYAAYLVLNDNLHIPRYFFQQSLLSATLKYTLWHAATLFLLLLPLLVGIYYSQVNSGKMMTHVRKGWYLFMGQLVMGMIISLFGIEKTSENLTLVLVPIAVFHGYGYLNAEFQPYARISFWASVIFVVCSQLYSGLWF